VVGLKVRLVLPPGSDPHLGDLWDVVGVLRPPSEGSEALFHEQGLQGTLGASRAVRVADGPAVFAVADDWRTGFSRFTHAQLPPDSAEWIDSLCFHFGDLSTDDKQDLQLSGMYFLVAASGLHVFVLTGLVMVLAGALRLPRSVGVLAVVVVLSLYCLASGLHFATARAAVASLVFLSAYLFGREPDSLSAMALAASAYLLLFPGTVYSMGFQLSVVVIAAVALFLPRRRSAAEGFKGRITANALSCAWAAAIFLLAGQPIVALYTGHFGIAEMPASLLTAFVAPVAIGLCFVAYAIEPVAHVLAAGLLQIALPLTEFLRVTAHSLAGLGLAVELPSFSGYWLVPYYALWLLTWRPRAVPA
jgi:competence protein ComEC